jgi:hypothetical protein
MTEDLQWIGISWRVFMKATIGDLEVMIEKKLDRPPPGAGVDPSWRE